MPQPQVDVSLNIFARPYQTALSILSLLKYSGSHIDKFYLQFEPKGSRYDLASPYIMAAYLGERAVVHQPEEWLECQPVDLPRLAETGYRLSVRYQDAFERSDKKYLFIMHNDVMIKRDIIGAMLDEIGHAFAIGSIGQCWNCPAHNAVLMAECGLGEPCGPERYQSFRPDFEDVKRLYTLAKERGVRVRSYLEGFSPDYSGECWPLPECRVNEWGCMVDLEQTRPLVMPQGAILPFGAYEKWGQLTLDIAVPWFHDLHGLGLRAKFFPLDKYLKHTVGAHRMTKALHREAELWAEGILLKAFPDFVDWCKKEKNGMFAG